MSFMTDMCGALGVQCKDPAGMNPLVLAYVGDSLFDLAVRTLAVQTHDAKAHGLHVMCAARVRASAQAVAADAVLPLLNDAERAVFNRARNAKPGSVPKNASLADYALATALEAVIGYAYLAGDEKRALEIIRAAIDAQGEVGYKNVKAYKPG